ncbi:MAG: fimbria/pilus outer membrane usher protein [Gammaproteobacteria bacterium]|nr:fimbria/pilus outer membrane usher protein [Gammaproteobacteria bacterium]
MLSPSLWANIDACNHRFSGPEEALAASEYNSLLLLPTLNGFLAGQATQFLRQRCGDIYVREADARFWRLLTHNRPATLLDGEYWVNLSEFPGLEVEIDPVKQKANLLAVPEILAISIVDYDQPSAPVLTKQAYGAYLDYSLFGLSPRNGDAALSANVDVGLMTPHGVLSSRWGYQDVEAGDNVQRVSTVFQKDIIPWTARLNIGDVTGSGQQWTGAATLGGVRLFSNYQIRPGLITVPVTHYRLLNPSLSGGELRQRYWPRDENSTGAQFRYLVPGGLPPGPVDFANVPIGRNQITTAELVTTEGNVIAVEQKHFYNRGLIRQGLHQYDVSFGLQRTSDFSNNYREFAALGAYRYGLTAGITLESGFLYSDSHKLIEFGGSLVIPWVGSGRLLFGHSRNEIGGSPLSDDAVSFDFSNRFRWIGWSAGYEARGRRFGGLNFDGDGGFKDQVRSSLSLELSPRDRIGLSSQWATHYEDGRSRRHAFVYSRSFVGGGVLSLTVARAIDNEGSSDTGFLSLSLPIGVVSNWLGRGGFKSKAGKEKPIFNLNQTRLGVSSARAESGDISTVSNIRLRGDKGGNPYSLSLSNVWGQEQVSVSAGYVHPKFVASFSTSLEDGEVGAVGGSLLGSFVYTDKTVQAHRQNFGSYALVKMGEDAEGVRVNGTPANTSGTALVSGLQSYQQASVVIDRRDLPISARYLAEDLTIIPGLRTVSILDVPVSYPQSVLVTLKYKDARGNLNYVPVGASARELGQKEWHPVGTEGLLYLPDVSENAKIEVQTASGICEFSITVPKNVSPDDIPDLGTYECI